MNNCFHFQLTWAFFNDFCIEIDENVKNQCVQLMMMIHRQKIHAQTNEYTQIYIFGSVHE